MNAQRPMIAMENIDVAEDDIADRRARLVSHAHSKTPVVPDHAILNHDVLGRLIGLVGLHGKGVVAVADETIADADVPGADRVDAVAVEPGGDDFYVGGGSVFAVGESDIP